MGMTDNQKRLVFPANAGMIPTCFSAQMQAHGVPRECGDDVGSFRISSASPFDSTGLSWKTIFAMCIENVMGTYLCSFP